MQGDAERTVTEQRGRSAAVSPTVLPVSRVHTQPDPRRNVTLGPHSGRLISPQREGKINFFVRDRLSGYMCTYKWRL